MVDLINDQDPEKELSAKLISTFKYPQSAEIFTSDYFVRSVKAEKYSRSAQSDSEVDKIHAE